ncbi:MAG: GrpB family protein [Phormidesmis sp.]
MIEVVDYTIAWPKTFESLKSFVWPALKDIAISIEHVGSTSVPDLAAKPIIDMDVIIPANQPVSSAIARLAPLGYIHRGNLGILGRDAFTAPTHLPAHHLYVCLQGSLGLQNHLAVRDYLRSHPQVAKTYSELKKSLAQQFPHDIDRYIAGKTDFLLNILRQCDFSSSDRQAIESINRGLN